MPVSRSLSRTFLPNWALVIAACAALLVVGVSIGAFEYVDRQAEVLLAAREAVIAEEELKLLEDIFQEEGRAGLIRAVARRAALPSDNLGMVAIADQAGTPLVGNVVWPGGARVGRNWRPISTVSSSGVIVSGFARATTLSDGTRVLVGRNFSANQQFRAHLSDSLLSALALLLVVSLGAGFALNIYVLLRIDAIARTAHRISRDNLAERMPVGASSTEFDRLCEALNLMLDRNEAHVAQMRTMTDAISHDLRIPLQKMKSGLRVAATVVDHGQQQQAIEQAISDADSALSTFDALLAMARAEAGIGRDSFLETDLCRLISDVAELFEPLAEAKGQHLSVILLPLTVPALSVLLKQAVGNLVQNTIKYTPPGGRIVIRLAESNNRIQLTVEDNGPGIPEADLERAILPFGRLARDRDSEGSGLGLALAASFAKLHGGILRLEDANPGLRAIIEIPRAG